jgi:outer membrane autotransporter protein
MGTLAVGNADGPQPVGRNLTLPIGPGVAYIYDLSRNFYIGTNAAGTSNSGFCNGANGILITGASAGNLIGGQAAGINNPTGSKGNTARVFQVPPQGNLISGNQADGILIINLGTGPLGFDGGTLQALAAGGGIISNKAITLNALGGTFLADAGTASNLAGAISGTGALIKDGLGALALSGKNTYTGGTVLQVGTLTVNGAQALGFGNLMVNGGILRADPQPINVKGNYVQNAGGTLQLQVGGANPGQYDSLNVGGNAALGGTLQLISLGFQPKSGDQLTLVTTGGVISGRFAQFLNPFASGAGFTLFGLIYGENSVLLEFRSAASFALTPNERAAASLLDAVHLDPRAANLISFLNREPFANLPGDFEKISPDGLTAFYEISFSNANIQRLNLESRLDNLHHGSNGFSSNMKINSASVNLEARGDADGKSSKEVAEPILQHGPENRWGVWVTGFGDFVNVDGDGNAQGYNFTTGGVSLGIDYRITDQLAIGVMGGYSHTWTSLNPAGHIDVDSGRGGVYATWDSHGIYLNRAIYGGHNNYDSSRAGLGGLVTGGTEGAEWSTFMGGGYDFHCGSVTVGPIASLQYTDVQVDGFSEKGSLAPLQIHSDSAESLRSDVGFRLFYQWQIGKVVLEPSLKAAWEHEYKYSALPITAGLAGIPGPSATFFGPSEGHDSAVVSAGISVRLSAAISTYLNYDGQLGRDNYDSNAVTGGFRISF